MRGRAGATRSACTLLFVTILVAAAPTAGADHDASVGHLRRAVMVRRDGGHLSRLFALRQLHDPALRPFFHGLVAHEDWQVQVHAVLGLAETAPNGRVDPRLVLLAHPLAQEAMIANAIDMKLIGPVQIRELLAEEAVPSISRAMLAAELLLAGEPVNPEILMPLTDDPEERVAGLACLVLAESGDPEPLATFTAELVTENLKPIADSHVLWLLEAIRQYRFTAAAPWIRGVLEAPDLDHNVSYWSIFTLLRIDPTHGLAAWGDGLGAQPTDRDRIRFGMVLLAAGESVPAAAFDRLAATENELVLRLVAAGRAVSAGADAAAPLIALLEIGQLQTSSWAMETLRGLPDEQAAEVYRHLIDTVEADGRGGPERISRAVEAATQLYEIDPEAVVERLRAAEDDGVTQEVILLGLFESRSPETATAARTVRRIGFGRADSLALLLIARHSDTLERDELKHLGRIAAGGGRVSVGLQVQAAWLYLKHTGAAEDAVQEALGAGS